MTSELIRSPEYQRFISELKTKVRNAQLKAAVAVNQELIELYWDIGKMIDERQKESDWGDNVIGQIAQDLTRELDGLKGFSRRNLFRIKQWYAFYADQGEFVPQAVAQIPWGHNALIIEKVKDTQKALWYVHKTLENNWARSVLQLQIESGLYERQAESPKVENFAARLPALQSDLARQMLKDPYMLDVRHDALSGIPNLVRRLLGRKYLSQPIYLEPKGEGENSILVKRRSETKCPNQSAARLAEYGES